jgi:hypothetical protein
MSYFNIPASPERNNSQNPMNILKAIANKNDFVVFKIDIDNDPVEWELIKYILDDKNVSSLIDELYFEHHVNKHPVEFHGWGQKEKLMNTTESYKLFESLRKIGIRAHSWV